MRRTVITFIAALALLVPAGAAVAAAAPHGVLSATEFQQLNTAGAKIDQLKKANSPNWSKIFAACYGLHGTPLLTAERKGCATKFQEVKAIIGAETTAKNESACEKKGESAPKCLLPAYARLDKQADKAVIVDVAARNAASVRGFTGQCYEVLSASAKTLRTDRKFASVMDQSIVALRTLNGPKLVKLGPELTASLKAVLREGGPSEFALCKHQ